MQDLLEQNRQRRHSNDAVFLARNSAPLTRFGIYKIVRRHTVKVVKKSANAVKEEEMAEDDDTKRKAKFELISEISQNFINDVAIVGKRIVEEIFIKDTLRKYDFCEAQFRSTRDAMCSNWFSDILWGGMQWQLEHRLFPTLTLP